MAYPGRYAYSPTKIRGDSLYCQIERSWFCVCDRRISLDSGVLGEELVFWALAVCIVLFWIDSSFAFSRLVSLHVTCAYYGLCSSRISLARYYPPCWCALSLFLGWHCTCFGSPLSSFWCTKIILVLMMEVEVERVGCWRAGLWERSELSWILDGEREVVWKWLRLDVLVVLRHSAPRPVQASRKIE
jgi:hypothetical protein